MTSTAEAPPEQAYRLQKARLARGMADAKAAAAFFGWNYNTYIQHERGERGIRPKVAEKYGKAYRVSAAWIMLGDGIGPSDSNSNQANSIEALSQADLYNDGLRDTDRILISVSDLREGVVYALQRSNVKMSKHKAETYAAVLIATLANYPGVSAVVPLAGIGHIAAGFQGPKLGDPP